jgi:hypothetical protein
VENERNREGLREPSRVSAVAGEVLWIRHGAGRTVASAIAVNPRHRSGRPASLSRCYLA